MNEENNLPRVTIDTNLVISGTISPNSLPNQLVTSWAKDAFNWIITDDTFNELKDVLSRDIFKTKYHINEEEAQAFLENLAVGAEFVNPTPIESLPIHSRDKKDDILLACALGGNCDFLLTGDGDLLVLNGKEKLGKLQIIEVAEFLKRKR